MAYAAKGTGTVFNNEQKNQDSQPDYRGSLFLSSQAINDIKAMDCFASPEGAYADIAMWKKVSRDGKEFFSLSISAGSEKEQRYQAEKQSKYNSSKSNAQPDQQSAPVEDVPF